MFLIFFVCCWWLKVVVLLLFPFSAARFSLFTSTHNLHRLTCSRTGPRDASCCLFGSRAASCTCRVLGARSRDGSCRWRSPWCRRASGPSLASKPETEESLEIVFPPKTTKTHLQLIVQSLVALSESASVLDRVFDVFIGVQIA